MHYTPLRSKPRALCALASSVLASVALLLAVAPAAAQSFGRNKVQYDYFDFRSFETEHFEFFYYPEEKLAVADAARMGERWYRRHARTFLREFHERKPIIFYANDADFQQTNVIGGMLGQGTGGVTESLKERVVMPLTGIYSETDHVLGHELVHSFQYDIGLARNDSSRFALQLLPLWLVEGMAEYLSVGREDVHTAMWMRDAVLRDDLPTTTDLSKGNKYFPYRYGQAYMAYIGGKYGDAAVANLFKMGGRTGLDSAFVYTLGITGDSLSAEWALALKETFLPFMEGRVHPDSAGQRVLADDISGSSLNLSPAVSPDGQYVAYLSNKDLFNINLFIADARTGKAIRKLQATNTDPHFDNIRFINSAGSWSPDGKKFAFITFVQGDNEISIWDLDSGSIERRISVEGVSAMSNPAWSPDGRSIAFSGIDGGRSDLYVLDLLSGNVRQLTNDRYADLQPAWSPDGQTIAVVSDRGPGGTDLETLSYAAPRLALVTVASGEMRILRPFSRGKHINPQFSPDGRSLYFIADHDGFSDIYRYALDTDLSFRVTRLKTGVSGITALSPAMSVATQNGRIMYSVFSNGEFSVFGLEADQTTGVLADGVDDNTASLAGTLPPHSAVSEGLVADYLDDPLTGLPEAKAVVEKEYKSGLRLDAVAPPSVGVSVGGIYGSGVAGGVGFYFSDMLGNKSLNVIARANGTFKDIGGMVVYMNRGRRFNYGGAVSHIPLLYGGPIAGYTGSGNYVVQDIRNRIFVDQAVVIGSYPFTTTRRVEIFSGFTRYAFDYEVIQFIYTPFGIDRQRTSAPRCRDLEPSQVQTRLCERDPIYFFHGGAAFVGDFSNFGFTSPIQGGRYRFEVAPRVGTGSYVAVLADYRRYFFLNPVTFAVRGMHTGNYGATNDDIFANEYLGYAYYPGFVRGYSINSFDVDAECPGGNCQTIYNRLFGTRIAVASAELRLPLLGTDALGLINFPYLPTEITAFSDAGLAWNQGENPFDMLKFETRSDQRIPVISVGTSARFNLLGYIIFEIYYAYPFQRPDKGAHFGFQLTPGW